MKAPAKGTAPIGSPESESKRRRQKMPKWAKAFLTSYRNSQNVRASAEAAGIDRTTPYNAAESNPEFAAAWQQAKDDAVDVLEAQAWQRARKSDKVLMFLLRAHRPDTYGSRSKVEVDIPNIDILIERELAQLAAERKTGAASAAAAEAGSDGLST